MTSSSNYKDSSGRHSNTNSGRHETVDYHANKTASSSSSLLRPSHGSSEVFAVASGISRTNISNCTVTAGRPPQDEKPTRHRTSSDEAVCGHNNGAGAYSKHSNDSSRRDLRRTGQTSPIMSGGRGTGSSSVRESYGQSVGERGEGSRNCMVELNDHNHRNGSKSIGVESSTAGRSLGMYIMISVINCKLFFDDFRYFCIVYFRASTIYSKYLLSSTIIN